jgi:hypothetical protein
MSRISFLLVLTVTLFASCEDVIDVDLNYSSERLVIEGQLNWIKETQQTEQRVILSKTTPYFENLRIPANGAEVQVKDEQNNTYQFMEQGNSGTYFPLDTLPFKLGSELTLEIRFEDQKYRGSEVLNPVAAIYEIKQDSFAFFGSTATQLEAYSVDPEDEVNFSFFEFVGDRLNEPEYNVFRDDFSNGSEYYGVLVNGDLEKGDSIRFRQYSLSKTAYQYWYLVFIQNTQQGGPFQTNPANLNGNMTNLTKPENSPLGYFRVSEVSEVHYLVK